MKIAALRHMQICRQHASILFRRLKESAFDQMLKQSRINGGYVFLGHILLLETLADGCALAREANRIASVEGTDHGYVGEVEQNNFINKLHRCSLHGADDALFA